MPEEATHIAEPRGDDYLVLLIKMAEKSSEEDNPFAKLDLTLNVGGMLVTGRLISHERFAQQFILGAIHDAINEAVEQGKLPPAPEDDGERFFIHLENARFFMPGQLPIPTNGPGVLRRGPLKSVDGFTMGELRAGDPQG